MDLIDRQEAINALCKAGCDSGHCGVSCDDVKAIEDLPSADELTIVAEHCRKRNLVLITMESFRVLQAYYNRQNGMDGEHDE